MQPVLAIAIFSSNINFIITGGGSGKSVTNITILRIDIGSGTGITVYNCK